MRVTTAHRKVECIPVKQTGREVERRGESVVPMRCAFNSLAGAGAQPGVQPAVRRSTDAGPRGGPPSSSLGAPAQVGRDRLGAYRGKPVRGLEPRVARGPARSVRKRRPPVVWKSVIGFQVFDRSAHSSSSASVTSTCIRAVPERFGRVEGRDAGVSGGNLGGVTKQGDAVS